jgi:hypothetical protein
MEDKKPLEDLNGPLPKSFNFYIEDGKYVFTKEFHLSRGFCCGNQCRHCAFFPTHKKGSTTIFIDNG